MKQLLSPFLEEAGGASATSLPPLGVFLRPQGPDFWKVVSPSPVL